MPKITSDAPPQAQQRISSQVTPPATPLAAPQTTSPSEPPRKDGFEKQSTSKSQPSIQSPPVKTDARGAEQAKSYNDSKKGFYAPAKRNNAFHKDGTENENIHSVIYQSDVPQSSVGWNKTQEEVKASLFTNLGNPRHPVGSLQRNAEQEYLLSNMPKGAMHEAARIATQSGVGIAVRGTGLLAHMGIESGNPTKAQEFKNKTSKEMDLWLCPEMSFGDVGAVVHYDPRVGWSSQGPALPTPPDSRENPKGWNQFVDTAWKARREDIEQRLSAPETGPRSQLKSLVDAQKLSAPGTEADWDKLKAQFKTRLTEFADEDPNYRAGGHYAEHVKLEGPFIHLPQRPGVHMYGDHDLFAFTQGSSGRPTLDNTEPLRDVQRSLQDANTFQAQHGGIWNWQPAEASHEDIKKKIMGAHSPPNGEPLLYIQPNDVVTAAFYVPGDKAQGTEDRLVPVWDCPEATKWLESTHSGRALLAQRARDDAS